MSFQSSKPWVPYIYLLKHKASGYVYIGCRYAKGCHPSDLLVKYKTSSKDINYILKRDGANAFDKYILKEFDLHQIISKNTLLIATNYDIIVLEGQEVFNAIKTYVLSQESKYLRRLRVKKRLIFFNRTDGTETYGKRYAKNI